MYGKTRMIRVIVHPTIVRCTCVEGRHTFVSDCMDEIFIDSERRVSRVEGIFFTIPSRKDLEEAPLLNVRRAMPFT